MNPLTDSFKSLFLTFLRRVAVMVSVGVLLPLFVMAGYYFCVLISHVLNYTFYP